MKNIKPTQVLNGKMRPKQIAQFVGGKEVKARGDTASVSNLDLAPAQMMVEFEMSRPIDRVDEHGWRAADRAHGGNKMALCYSIFRSSEIGGG
jgi:hypothetical protein